jgi:hypothetical protein
MTEANTDRPLVEDSKPAPVPEWSVAPVDPQDDNIRRHVVRHYSYDPERRERRHQTIGAFDRERQAIALLKKLSRQLQRRRSQHEAVDPAEHYSAITLEVGHQRLHQNARLLRAALRHGASVADGLELPPSVGILRSVNQDSET